MREKSVVSLLEVDFVNELMSHPSIDSNHRSDPYMSMEPLEAMLSGEYAKDVDVLIGIQNVYLFLVLPCIFQVLLKTNPLLEPKCFMQHQTCLV